MAVTKKDTIRLSVLRSDGPLGDLVIHGVMYAPGMFVSVLSHYQLKQQSVSYHGLDDKLYHHVGGKDSEVAYTPEIDKIPTFLLTDDEIQAAQVLALAAVGTTTRTSVLTPTRDIIMRDLHVTFDHADVRTLRQMVKTMTGFRLNDDNDFTCEACLSNSMQQISRQPPNRSATFGHRIHVDIVGPVTPIGRDGERYWVIYTDDYSRH